MSPRPFPWLSLIALGVLAGGCETVEDEGSNECNTNADCPLGRVCVSFEHQCHDEYTDGFVGSFSCIVMPSGQAPPSLGTSDVVGWFANNRYALNRDAQCMVTSAGHLQIYLLTYLPSGEAFYAGVSFPELRAGVIDAEFGNMILQVPGQEGTVVGNLTLGQVDLYQTPVVGGYLQGFILFSAVP